MIKPIKQCPFCWAGSYKDEYEQYDACVLQPSGQNMTECTEGHDSCIIDYFHYKDEKVRVTLNLWQCYHDSEIDFYAIFLIRLLCISNAPFGKFWYISEFNPI